MHIAHYNGETIFCLVSPHCPSYGKVHFPVFTFYNDGSFSHMEDSLSYFRSKPGRLPKPRNEYTLSELANILNDVTLLYKGM